MQKKTTTKSGNRGTKAALLVVNFLLLIGLGVFGGYYFTKYNDLKTNPPSQEEVAKAELAAAVKGVSTLYGDLPTDEEPQLATVRDKELLKDQEFFAKAENGDQALIYTNAKLAILYRPSTKQIINVSTVNLQSEVPKVQVIGQKSDRDAVEKDLQKSFTNLVEVIDSASAKGIYGSTIVVPVSPESKEAAAQIAEAIGGKVGTLPDGEEVMAGADILIVAGAR
jgi:uncharacterized protein YneF (UPF0154 family)